MQEKSKFSFQGTQNDVKTPEKWIKKNIRMDVYVCACIKAVKNWNVYIAGITRLIELKLCIDVTM